MATKKYVVTGEQDATFYSRRFDLERQWRARVLDPNIVLPGLQALNEPGNIVSVTRNIASAKTDWIIPIISAEHKALHDFFGQEFDLSAFAKKLKEIGSEKIAWWKKNLFEVHYLPPFVFQQGVKLPSMEAAIPDNYYKYLSDGHVFRDDVNGELAKITDARLEGSVILIDTRLKPAYNGGKQMWKKDGLVGGAVKKLRKNGKIDDYDPQNSRFNVSADEISEISKVVAIALKVDACRPETTTERIIIPQLYRHMLRKDDGKTNTSVWCDEFCGSRRFRFRGGNSDCGGLADVSASDAGDRWRSRSFRFLAVL